MEDILSWLAWGFMALFLIYISANANKQNITKLEQEEKEKEEKTKEENS